MEWRPVVPEQPVQNFIFGLTTPFELLAMQPFDFERSKQRLTAGIVPAIAWAAHRALHTVLAQYLLKCLAGILAATITMKDQPHLFGRPTLEPGHLESVHHQFTAPHFLQRPAYNLTAEQVHHDGQKQPAFVGREIGHIAHPRLIGSSAGELAIQHIVGYRKTMSAVGGSDSEVVSEILCK